MLTGSTFYRSATERQSQLKRASSKATGKKGPTEGEMRRQMLGGGEKHRLMAALPSRVPSLCRLPAVSFSKSFQTARQRLVTVTATHSSHCLQPAFRSAWRPVLLPQRNAEGLDAARQLERPWLVGNHLITGNRRIRRAGMHFCSVSAKGTCLDPISLPPRSQGFRLTSHIFEIVQPFYWRSSEPGPRALSVPAPKSSSNFQSSGTFCKVARHADKRKWTKEKLKEKKGGSLINLHMNWFNLRKQDGGGILLFLLWAMSSKMWQETLSRVQTLHLSFILCLMCHRCWDCLLFNHHFNTKSVKQSNFFCIIFPGKWPYSQKNR